MSNEQLIEHGSDGFTRIFKNIDRHQASLRVCWFLVEDVRQPSRVIHYRLLYGKQFCDMEFI